MLCCFLHLQKRCVLSVQSGKKQTEKQNKTKQNSFSEVLWFICCLYLICIFLFIKVRALSCLTLSSDAMDCSPPVSPVHGILHARILEWVTISLSSPCLLFLALAGEFFTISTALEVVHTYLKECGKNKEWGRKTPNHLLDWNIYIFSFC